MKRIAALFVLIALCLPAGAGAQKKAASAPAKQPAASAPVAQPAPDPAPATTVAASPAPAQAAAPRKKRVAIFDFDYATVRSGIAAMFGSDIDVGKGISDLLVKNLVTDGTYSVIERKALDKILAEQNFSNSDRANPTSAAKIGKILGLDAILQPGQARCRRVQVAVCQSSR